jgi:hypothetical protein
VAEAHGFKQMKKITVSIKPLSILLVDLKVHRMRDVHVLGFKSGAQAQISIRLSRTDKINQYCELSYTS